MFFKKVEGYQAHIDNKYTFEKKRFGLKWYKKFLKSVNSYGYLSENLGMELERLYKDVGYIEENGEFIHLGYDIGIHLTGFTLIQEEIIADIFNKGLINNGHAMNGGGKNTKAPSLDLTLTFIDDLPIAINQLKNGHSYKFSQGAVLVKIPHELKKESEIVQYFDGDVYRILPNYIYGIIELRENGIVGEIIKNPNFKLEEKLTR